MYIDKKDRTHQNILYRKIYRIWWHMIGRCYNPKDSRYDTYGGDGVTTSCKWRDFDGFLEDIDSVEGFDMQGILDSRLVLDKDYKVKGNKLYSLDTCMFISPEKNLEYRPNYMTEFIIMDRWGNQKHYFNKAKACRENDLTSETLQNLLRFELYKSKKDLQARYVSDLEEVPFIPVARLFPHVIVFTPKGRLIEYNSLRDAAEAMPDVTIKELWKYMGGNVTNRIGKNIKACQVYWKKEFDPEYLKKPVELKPYRVKYQRMLVEELDGANYCVIDEKLFAKSKGITLKALRAKVEPRYLALHANVKPKKYKITPIYIEPEY